MDSAFYGGAPIAACRRAGVRFSVTARTDPKIARAIAGIPEDAWTPIQVPERDLRRGRAALDLRRAGR